MQVPSSEYSILKLILQKCVSKAILGCDEFTFCIKLSFTRCANKIRGVPVRQEAFILSHWVENEDERANIKGWEVRNYQKQMRDPSLSGWLLMKTQRQVHSVPLA